MDLLPICPTQAGYGADFRDGIIQISLDGGAPRSRVDIPGGAYLINAQWVVQEDDYSLLQGFYRRQKRSGFAGFLADLVLDTSGIERYEATFQAGSFRLTSKNGPVFTVTASMWVYPLAKYEDPETDPYEYILDLIPYYGSVENVRRMMNLLEKLVNVDWPDD